MTCDLSPQPADYELLAYLDGEADVETVAHLDHCSHCQARAARLAEEEARLKAALFRLTCPEPQQLGEFHLGLLPRKRAAAIRDHLGECRRCRQEVAQLAGYLGELAPELSLSTGERVRAIVARLVHPPASSRAPGVLAPAYLSVRGAGDGPRLYRAEGVHIALEIEPDAARPGRLLLLGLVTGGELLPKEALLERDGAPLDRAPVDELGNFVFASLPPAVYDLVLTGPESEIRIPYVSVGTDVPQEESP